MSEGGKDDHTESVVVDAVAEKAARSRWRRFTNKLS